ADNKVPGFDMLQDVHAGDDLHHAPPLPLDEFLLIDDTVLLGGGELFVGLECALISKRKKPPTLPDIPMFRDGAKPLEPAFLVRGVSGEAHADSPSIMALMRSVTFFKSASIAARSRGGSKT